MKPSRCAPAWISDAGVARPSAPRTGGSGVVGLCEGVGDERADAAERPCSHGGHERPFPVRCADWVRRCGVEQARQQVIGVGMTGQGPGELLGCGVLDAQHRGVPGLGAVSQDPFGGRLLRLALAMRPRRLGAGLLQRPAQVAPALVPRVGAAHERTGELISERNVGVVGIVRPEAERPQRFGEPASFTHRAGQLGAGARP